MKKILAILLALVLVFGLCACGGNNGGETDGEDTRIRLVYIVNGTLGDKSFFDSGAEGLKWIDEQYGDQVYTEVREMTYDSSLWEATTSDIVAEGWDIVVAGTWDMKGYIEALAPEYPDTNFWFFDESWDFDANPCDNVYGILFAQNQGSFLVGMAAAAMTQTGKVGYMGGMPNTVLNDFMVGYCEGVDYYCQQTGKTVETVVAWTQSFSDSSIGKDIALGMYQNGCDVVFSCCGSCGLGTFDAAIEMGDGYYVIGVDGDQGAYFASTGDQAKSDVTVTSMMKCVNYAFLDSMTAHLDGTLAYGTNATLGLDGNYVQAAPSNLLSDDDLALIEAARDGIISGDIALSTAFGMDEDTIAAYNDGSWND